jgi:hypothetical protein
MDVSPIGDHSFVSTATFEAAFNPGNTMVAISVLNSPAITLISFLYRWERRSYCVRFLTGGNMAQKSGYVTRRPDTHVRHVETGSFGEPNAATNAKWK